MDWIANNSFMIVVVILIFVFGGVVYVSDIRKARKIEKADNATSYTLTIQVDREAYNEGTVAYRTTIEPFYYRGKLVASEVDRPFASLSMDEEEAITNVVAKVKRQLDAIPKVSQTTVTREVEL